MAVSSWILPSAEHVSNGSLRLAAIRRVIVLEDNDILHLARGTYNIYNLQRDDPSAKVASVSRALSRLDMEVSTSLRHLLFILSFCQCVLGVPLPAVRSLPSCTNLNHH